jgi:two-component system chemotaxis sensor kinase CheA
MDDLLREFLTESSESLAVLDLELVKLEQNPNNPDLLGNIFRLVHTIKGTCGFLGLPRLESVAHASENVLGKVRDGELEVTPEIVSLILKSLDRIKSILAALEQTEAEPAGDDTDLKARLNALADGTAAPAAPAAPPEAVAAKPVVAESAPVETAPETHSDATRAAVAAIEDQAAREPSVAAQSIRVHVNLLENLMTMVSELVLTRNQLLQILRGQKESDFAAPLQRLNLVTSELQEGVMKTRMQPIGNAWAKLPRMVRDLAHELNKKIDLRMQGAETELDRQVLELIKDPLTHLVRNCADHGLERPEDRRGAGKTETGRINLDAYHEGGQIVIEIADDGRGLPIDKIKSKAIANGLASEAELSAMSDEQIQQFIFRAGFSTAAQITNVSGRGVGMDVVRTNIEKIGGTIELRSKVGKGTAFFIKIPLTLAIVSALIVEAGAERFAVPQISVIELVRATANSGQKIEHIKGAPFLRLRNRLLPLVNLSNLLKLGADAGKKADDACIVVTQVGKHTFGIVVDRVFDTEEIVVKPVAPILRDISMFAGNTILGDGSVIMILDPNGIASAIGDAGIAHDQANEVEAAQATTKDDRVALLLFKAGGGTPKAVPLALVARLEEVDATTIEISDGKPVMQYRGQLMPLVTIDQSVKVRQEGRQPILVFADGSRTMGLLVDEIVDIVEERMNVQLGTDRTGLLGGAIIAGKATEIVDAGHFLTKAFDNWFAKEGRGSDDAKTDAKRVLLVDDSPFFRNLLTPLLSVAGYDVTSVDGADKALALCEAGRDFDVIVSDIEMPGMSGFEFAETVRKGGRWQDTPLVALSAHTSARDLDRGRKAGFVDYIAKLDREALLNTLSQTVVTKGAA